MNFFNFVLTDHQDPRGLNYDSPTFEAPVEFYTHVVSSHSKVVVVYSNLQVSDSRSRAVLPVIKYQKNNHHSSFLSKLKLIEHPYHLSLIKLVHFNANVLKSQRVIIC